MSILVTEWDPVSEKEKNPNSQPNSFQLKIDSVANLICMTSVLRAVRNVGLGQHWLLKKVKLNLCTVRFPNHYWAELWFQSWNFGENIVISSIRPLPYAHCLSQGKHHSSPLYLGCKDKWFFPATFEGSVSFVPKCRYPFRTVKEGHPLGGSSSSPAQ